MPHRCRFTIPRAIALPVLLAGAVLLLTRVASSQARGSLQVTATVVQTQADFDGLKAANQAAVNWAANGEQATNDISKVAQVTITRPADARDEASADVVVSIGSLKQSRSPKRCFRS